MMDDMHFEIEFRQCACALQAKQAASDNRGAAFAGHISGYSPTVIERAETEDARL